MPTEPMLFVPAYPDSGMLLQMGKRIGYERVFHLYSTARDNDFNKAENEKELILAMNPRQCGDEVLLVGHLGGSIAGPTAPPPYTVIAAFPKGACSLAERQ
jgi:hypothetical protein